MNKCGLLDLARLFWLALFLIAGTFATVQLKAAVLDPVGPFTWCRYVLAGVGMVVAVMAIYGSTR